MKTIGRRTATGLALLAICATLIPVGTPARAAHPGGNGGLTYPVAGGIRVHQVDGSYYDIPYDGMGEGQVVGATDVAWAPDGRALAFTLLAAGSSRIYVATAAGCHAESVTFEGVERAPAFDGVNMFFTSGTAGMQLAYHMDDPVSPVSGEPEPSGFGTDVAVSIIEGRWAHVEPPDAAHPDEYVLMLLDLFGREEEIEVFRSDGPIRGTEWAPDGSVLAFEATAEDGSTQIFAAEVVGDPVVVEQMTDATPNAVAPAFSPDGESMAWFRAADNRESGIVYVRDLATGEDTFATQQAKFALDWQPVHDAPGWEPAVPIETTTTVTLDEPSTGPGRHAVTVSVSPAPASGEVEVRVDDGEPYLLPLDETGTAHDVIDLDAGSHVVAAQFGGDCPHRPSSNQAAIEVPEIQRIFDDIADSQFTEEIEWLAEEGITVGCAPKLFCPTRRVTRGQMATFIAKALDLPAATDDHFTDDDGTTHEANINRLAEAGITKGCGSESFCPKRTLTRM